MAARVCPGGPVVTGSGASPGSAFCTHCARDVEVADGKLAAHLTIEDDEEDDPWRI